MQKESFRQAVRVATAMVIAYYISLSMGWDRPQWAGLAVALCSLATTGDTAGKGLLRVLGTVVAGTVALLLAAFFTQDRWAYLLVATIYIAFCSYMMASTSRWYFWFISGSVMALLAMAGGPEGATLFETIVLRVQQTTMGFVVFFVVASLLWPQKALPVLDKAVTDLITAQHSLFALYHPRISGAGPADADGREAKLRAQAARAQSGLPAIMNGAELDDFEVWFERARWRHCIADLAELNDALEQFRIRISDLGAVPTGTLTQWFANAAEEIEARFVQIERMMQGQPPDRQPRDLGLLTDNSALGHLPHFERSAIVSAEDSLARIDRLTKRLFHTQAEIRDFEPRTKPAAPGKGVASKPWDPDRLTAALRTFIALWMILFACIYIPDLPMPSGVVPMAAAVAIQMSISAFMPLKMVVVPGLGATALAWVFHVFVMPHLHGYLGLGAAMFVVIFAVMLLMADPKYAVGRPIITSFFVMAILVDNQQSYNPLFAFNYAIAFSLALMALWLSGLFPVSFRPQPILSTKLKRFFTSSSRLVASPQVPGEQRLNARGLSFHLQEVRTLPGKLRPWVARQPAVEGKRVAPQVLNDLLDSCDILAARLHDVADARAEQQSDTLRKELREDFRVWRQKISEILEDLADAPTATVPQDLRERHEGKLARVEDRIEQTLRALPPDAVTDEERVNMYRMLAAYRGVSEAVVLVSEHAAAIRWDEILENRF